jgi:flagellar protein FlaJ
MKLKKMKKTDKKKSVNKKKIDSTSEFKLAYNNIGDFNKYLKNILIPLISLGIIIIILPFIFPIIGLDYVKIDFVIFVLAGSVLFILGVFYPYLHWKNKEGDINGKIHFFITHLRVLIISDLSLKEIINILGGNKAYGSLGEEMKKISVLSDQWRLPLAKSFLFISNRTPSKIFKDFLDRFSQSLNSGVDPREFIETEQAAVLEEYKTMYETSNDNITILNEVYVSLLISIIFILSLGIVIPIIIGGEDMNTFIFLSSFLLIVSEGLLLYLLKSMVPPDEIWHLSDKRGENEEYISKMFKLSVVLCILIGVIFIIGFQINNPYLANIPLEIIGAICLFPLIIPGFKTYQAEKNISRKERNFLTFLPALGSISTMRGGKINESVYYLSRKDYGILSKHIKDLYKRLRTRIDDNSSWEWFGVDSGSNHIQRSSEMFRQATAASASPQKASRMISENIRKIRDLRVKKLSIVNTSAALFAGITFGIAFSTYTSLVIAQHLNGILLEGSSGDPFSGTNIDVGSILNAVQPQVFTNTFVIIFLVLIIHCFLMAFTVRTLRGSHIMNTLLYFVPLTWIVAITAIATSIGLRGYLGI